MSTILINRPSTKCRIYKDPREATQTAKREMLPGKEARPSEEPTANPTLGSPQDSRKCPSHRRRSKRARKMRARALRRSRRRHRGRSAARECGEWAASRTKLPGQQANKSFRRRLRPTRASKTSVSHKSCSPSDLGREVPINNSRRLSWRIDSPSSVATAVGTWPVVLLQYLSKLWPPRSAEGSTRCRLDGEE